MTHPIPPIERFMTNVLVVIGPRQPLTEATRLMRTHRVRHLPVMEHGKLLGLVSQRDVHLIETLDGVDPSRVLVEEAMTREVFSVEPDEPVDRVARAMAEKRIGSAVVSHGERLLGLFTTVDALRALATAYSNTHVLGEDVPSAAARG